MSPSNADTSESTRRLSALREAMKNQSLDAYIVRGTDRFLNEYVPTGESTRVWLSGFTGSTGDALVTLDTATMFVDGRYDVQARADLDPAQWKVEVLPLGVSIERTSAEKLAALAKARGGTYRAAYEPDRFSMDLFDQIRPIVESAGVELVPSRPTLIEQVRGPLEESRGRVRAVGEAAVGRTTAEKLAAVSNWLKDLAADALLVQRLDEIAYLTNLRGDELPFQATFRSVALVTRDAIILSVDPSRWSDALASARPTIRTVPEGGLGPVLSALKSPVVVVDPSGTTVAMRLELEAASARIVSKTSPLTAMKAKKTDAELRAMRSAFKRADRVVASAQRWLIEQVAAGAEITETAFAQQVEKMFRDSGAVGLSFKVISAVGENAADVHHPPDPKRVIRRGEMMLLDTGAYYDEGYATDLTRTFFVGTESDEPTAEMRYVFTLTLKSAIAGMTARVPRTATGAQLDGLTRAPLWARGMDYSHGTGHGVGINVHEAPPRVASVSLLRFEEGHVFSIEPGLYLEGRVGVRIENLCTVEPDPKDPRFLKVEPLTFSPLDARLIDTTLLDASETAFLEQFARRYDS